MNGRLVAALAVAVAAAALVLTACGAPGPTGPTGAPSPSSSVPGSAPPTAGSSTASPVAPSAAPSALSVCTPDGLASAITAWEGAAGSRIAWVEVQNVGAAPCLLDAPAAVALLDAAGQVLVSATGPFEGAGPVELPAGSTGRLFVGVANWCGDPPPGPVAIGLTLGGTRPFSVPSGDGVAFEPPPCNAPGDPPGITVGAEGWTLP